MAWVVDTNVLVDVAMRDPVHGVHSCACLSKYRADGLTISPITYAELAPLFLGNEAGQQQWLAELCVQFRSLQTWADVQAAWNAFGQCVARKRLKSGLLPARRVSDMLIGAFALRHQGLLTRNSRDFEPNFPLLKVITP